MTNALRTELEALASAFTAAIVAAIRSSSLAEILDVNVPQETRVRRLADRRESTATKGTDVAEPSTAPRPGRPVGTTTRDTGETVDLVVKYLRSHPGSSGEEARKSLGLVKHTWNARVSRAIKEGKVRKEGDRRATRYWAT
jgi:hypothetical protein